MSKMTDMPVYYMVKTFENLSLRNRMAEELDMQHQELGFYQDCSNDDPWLTLTYFTAKPNSVTWALYWKRANSGFSEAIVAYDIQS